MDKNNNFWKKCIRKCPLFAVSAISVLFFLIGGAIYVYNSDYAFYITLDHPAAVAMIQQEKAENVAVAEEETETDSAETTEPEETVTETEEESTTQEPVYELETDLSEYGVAYGNGGVTKYDLWNDNPARSRYYENPGVHPLTSDYDFKHVDASYYANSLFIGDSRMEGLYDYSGYDEASFCFKTGLTVFTMMTENVGIGKGLKSTVPEVLSSRSFDNIYIMIGINELGCGTPDSYPNKFKENLDLIREYQPDARIIILSIMYVTTEYSDESDVYNNDNINAKNAAIAAFANGKDIFYLDMNPAVVDETGGLDPEITFDGVHLKAKYYYKWVDFMNAHGY
ncbi:MAG: hypothetical protein KBT19_04365 [Lachnospiraceae bacterium]|nr:hypothetical protein [Candidatus Colinaster equi]